MSWYYSITLVNVKAILHSAAIVKIIFHPHTPLRYGAASGLAISAPPIPIAAETMGAIHKDGMDFLN